MPDYYIDHVVSAGQVFTLLSTYNEMRGTGTVFTYQNVGDIPVTVQGSLNNVDWSFIAEIEAGGSKVLQHSWKYVRKLEPLAEVLVTRGLD